MDPITSAVRAMYEQYPYPSGEPTLRLGSSARLVLSYGHLARSPGRPLRVLDAGCGRGLGAIGHATTEPDVEILGIDVNRVALAEAQAAAARRGLANLRFQEVDLMTLDGLRVPDGGFDVVYSFGVIHHLADPAAGLARLTSVLAPHGVVVLLVYGRLGREALYRLARAVDVAIPRDRPLAERLAAGRALVSTRGDAIANSCWHDAATVPDVEFVDRYLHVNETAYDVDGLWSLLEHADLRFLRWCAPEAWSIDELLPPGPARQLAAALSEKDRYRLVEQLYHRPMLDLIAGRAQNSPRRPITRAALARTVFRVNPEVSFLVEKRNLRGAQRAERLSVRLPTREPEPIPPGPLASAALILSEQNVPFDGGGIVGELATMGYLADAALDAVAELVRRGIIYAPHPADI